MSDASAYHAKEGAAVSPTAGHVGDRVGQQRVWPPVPEVQCPFPADFDPKVAEEMDARIAGWIDRIGLFPGQREEVSRFHLGTFTVRVHPRYVDLDRLMLAAKLMTVLFAVDDHYCDEEIEGAVPALTAERLAFACTALDAPDCGSVLHEQAERMRSDPVLAAFADFMEDLDPIATRAQIGRMRRGIISTLLAMAGENGWRTRNALPPLWEYEALRPYNGSLACTALIDVVEGFELPANEYDRASVRKLTLRASSLIMLMNDLCSAAKESATAVGSYSYPSILIGHGRSPQEAMAETAARHDTLMNQYLHLETALTRHATPQLRLYMQGLRDWIKGNLDWQKTTGRHHARTDRPTPAGSHASVPPQSQRHQDDLSAHDRNLVDES